MARWTLQMLQEFTTSTELLVITNTSKQDHLYMAWAYTRPSRTPIYRTVRGKLVFCGNTHVWDTPSIAEQDEEGDTWTHTFHLTHLTPRAVLWYYLYAPNPPSEWECQGPLRHVHLKWAWIPGTHLYFASRAKGMFRTTTFTGINGDHPVWLPDNEGLLDLHISQAVLDPFMPQHRRYLIAGPHLYRHGNDDELGPANSFTILTWPEAIALTGCVDGDIVWVQPNPRHIGMLHVLWVGTPTPCSFWHLRSLDYGQHWTAHLIAANTGSSSAGNIQPGFDKGTSPYHEGDVVYAAVNMGIFDTPHLARSIDQGITWTTLPAGDIAHARFRPRIHVDPSNQAVVYIGCDPAYYKCYRTQDHGDSWERIDRGKFMCPCLDHSGYYQTLRSHYSNPSLVREFPRHLVHTSRDYCASWTTIENLTANLQEAKFTDDNPNLLYMAKIVSGISPPPAFGPHTMFISDNDGLIFWPKSGAHVAEDDGGGDSIPWNCGGVADDGILIVRYYP